MANCSHILNRRESEKNENLKLLKQFQEKELIEYL